MEQKVLIFGEYCINKSAFIKMEKQLIMMK